MCVVCMSVVRIYRKAQRHEPNVSTKLFELQSKGHTSAKKYFRELVYSWRSAL